MSSLLRYCYIFLLLICGCNYSSNQPPPWRYFNLKTYFSGQQRMLSARNAAINKSITKDNVKESREISHPDWTKELKPFADCDLNKPAWLKSYSIDSILSDHSIHLSYTSMESKFPVQKMQIDINNDTVSRIQITINKQNTYYSSQQQLDYIPFHSYHINGTQKVILADPTSFIIDAKFN